jgi:DMSO/TMAO reductase YedYZ molybdopterin-dependent catalytic subunit
LVVSVGDWVIKHAPNGLVEFGKRNFGTDDKAVLVAVIIVLSLVFGALLGLAARRRFVLGAVGIAAFGIVGLLAALADPLHDAGSATFAAIVGVAAGIAVLRLLLRAAGRAPAVSEPGAPSSGVDRRAFLSMAAGAMAVGAASALIGRALLDSSTRAVAAARRLLHLPPATNPVAPPTAAMQVGVDGVTPLVTANGDFYRIDTALTFPGVDYDQWRLRIHGMVDSPFTVTYDDLAAMELIEQYATMQCVSNYVGGNLISTAAWRGIRLRDLLNRARVSSAADQVVGRAVDGFTVGFPTTAALDDRGAMVAIGMNGDILPIEHGFPARLIVPGLYGYVSATKWLSDIELTRFDRYDAYWVDRGWNQQGDILTQSRIDVPNDGGDLRAGPVAVAGVAWAPTRGIAKVEVQVDQQPWTEATLADALSADTWRQWMYRWDATHGQHRLRVRATDGTGALQEGRDVPPEPGGATGYHTVYVTVAR